MVPTSLALACNPDPRRSFGFPLTHFVCQIAPGLKGWTPLYIPAKFQAEPAVFFLRPLNMHPLVSGAVLLSGWLVVRKILHFSIQLGRVPSRKLLHTYRKSPLWMGNSRPFNGHAIFANCNKFILSQLTRTSLSYFSEAEGNFIIPTDKCQYLWEGYPLVNCYINSQKK